VEIGPPIVSLFLVLTGIDLGVVDDGWVAFPNPIPNAKLRLVFTPLFACCCCCCCCCCSNFDFIKKMFVGGCWLLFGSFCLPAPVRRCCRADSSSMRAKRALADWKRVKWSDETSIVSDSPFVVPFRPLAEAWKLGGLSLPEDCIRRGGGGGDWATLVVKLDVEQLIFPCALFNRLIRLSTIEPLELDRELEWCCG